MRLHVFPFSEKYKSAECFEIKGFQRFISWYLLGEFASLPGQIRRPSPPPSVGSDHGLLTAPQERFTTAAPLRVRLPVVAWQRKRSTEVLLFLLVSPRGVEPLIPP